ncbi:MAG: secretin N-terminal domain-containing protein [Humidesulfovibrio sp.]|uniref:secretin N-terminal domain-containing protein n=1 Tax=Humidesulfovibrio sp. TaxID=2910988 RepID=UPI0027FA59FD|nr:secretin N-terminal domain-containing protein [Humidesulfovibrio sp.]MDQ7834364.1 secretin N-terminal domain-containing protein [Humidesulfovibrio sp.]
MARAQAPRTCGLIAALFFSLFFGLGLSLAPEAKAEAAAGAAVGGGGLRVGLEGAAFKDFLLFMGQFSGKNPVFRQDQLPDATVTLVSRQGVDAAELAEMQGLVLGVAGLTAIARGELLYLLPEQGHPAPPQGPTQILAQRLGPGVSPRQGAGVLERVRSDTGQVVAGTGQWLVLRDQAERVARARAVLTALDDAPAGSELELMPLGRVEARLAARKLDMHFRGLPGPAPVVQALEWSNSLLLAGSVAQLDQARHLLARVDAGGREAPGLKAFRLRYAKADKVAAAIGELAAADKRLGGLRVSVDGQAGAVVVLAEPEFMARVERLVADLDQPKPRVLVEALVLELPARFSERDALLAVLPAPGGGVAALANPPVDAPAGGRGFALGAVGAGLSLRGNAVGNAASGSALLDALAALLAQDPEVRVLARPRAAVPDGGEMRLGITRPEPAAAPGAAQGPEAELQRLSFTPLQDADGTQVRLRVSLEEASLPGRQQVAEVHLPEGALLLLQSQELGAGQAAGKSQAGPRRLGIVLVTTVVRNAQSAPGASRSLSESKP